MVNVTLSKLKYRLAGKRIDARPWERPTAERAGVLWTWLRQAGKFTAKSANSGKAVKQQDGWGVRRKQGLGYTDPTGWGVKRG